MTRDKPAKHTHLTKPDLDWPAIMAHVRAGTRSYADIGTQYGVSKGRISQKAKELGVTRDLAPAIAARAAEKVARAGVNDAVNAATDALEADVVEINAETQARLIIAERQDVAQARAMLRTLQSRLQSAIKAGKGKAVARQLAALPEHIEMNRKLVETMRTTFAVERSVHNIEADTPIDPTKRMAEAVDNGFAGLKAAFEARLARK